MKRTTQLAQLYMVIVAIAGIIFFVLHLGNQLPPPPVATRPKAEIAAAAPATHDTSLIGAVTSVLMDNGSSPLSKLILQLIIIIVAASVARSIFTRLGQPAVVGEMVAGILLGPSLFGLLAPNAFQFVFATPTLGPLRLFSQIGVCLFLFVVGMELNVSYLRKKVETAVVVSHASIVVPYLLGVILALFVYSQYALPGTSFMAFA